MSNNEILKKRVSILGRVLRGIPEIRYVGDPVLREQAQLVSVNEGKIIGEQLGKVLLQYRKITGTGRGFAAPQIGLNKAVFVTFIDEKLQAFINPTIVEKSSETNFYKELCISSGVMSADVQRPEWIVMEWVGVEGVKYKKKFDGFLARLYQHEEAHLRGIVNLDEAAYQGIAIVNFKPLDQKLRKDR
jgi:peptide deformylase